MPRRYFVPLILLLVLGSAAVWQLGFIPRDVPDVRDTVPVNRFVLKNGLTVVVMPNARIPAVAHILFVRAGGADDPSGKSGLAHYLEHFMFTGTKQHPEGVYERAIVRSGGKQNAYTSRDFTAYYALVAKDQLAGVMAMEADRLQHLVFDPTRAAREIEVITEERHMRVENDPGALMNEQLAAVTFLNHPYRQPLIGWADDIAGLTVLDARAYLARHYVPSNMTLVLAGDVAVGEAHALAEKHYGRLKKVLAPERNWVVEPPHRAAITASVMDEKAHEPRLFRQYVAPSLGYGDAVLAYPLSVLAQHLGGGQAGLLYRTLVVEQKLATGVAVDYDEVAVGPALFRMILTPAPGVDLPKLEAALDGVLDGLGKNTLSTDDLARAKTGLKAQVIFAQDGLLPLAQLIGHLYMAGKNEQYFYDWPNHVEAVTAVQVAESAKTLLKPAYRVTGYLLPAPAKADDAASIKTEVSGVH